LRTQPERARPPDMAVTPVAGQSWPRRLVADGGQRCGARCHYPAPRRRQTIRISPILHFAICNLQFAICNLQSLIRRELFSRIRVIRAIGPRRRLLFGGQPKALPPAAPQDAPLPRSPSATSRLLKKSDAPCPLGAELSAIGLPPAIPRAPGALTPRGFGTCQLPARTKQSRWPSPETSLLRVRSEAARLTAGCRGVVFAGRPCHGTCSRGGPKPSGACFGLGTCASKATREGSAAGVVKRSGSSQVVQPRGTSPRGVRLFQQSPRAGGSETDQLPPPENTPLAEP
jgi:hypothetical protein